ncbi:MAG: DUF6798 domain-containing protein [Thermoguttaceae bacterium]
MTSKASPPWKRDLLEIVLIFAVFCVQGAWPVPDVNEPYYLGKAIHFWNPDWVRNDFFLESADAHATFYYGFGWLALWMSPVALAWFGRLTTWGLLAWSWQRLSRAVLPRPWLAVLGGGLFACLQERCHMAGEWVIGGAEAKGFAYVLVFLGLAAILQDRWNRAWLFLGGASLIHVLVGGWAAVAAGFTWLCLEGQRRSLGSMGPGLAGGLLLALPAVWLAWRLNWGVDPQTISQANQIYVYYRLPHHLMLHERPSPFLLRFAALIIVWVLVCRAAGQEGPARRLRAFVVGALAAALIGALLSLVALLEPALAAGLLRFYWFRLADVAVPLGTALHGIVLVERLMRTRPPLGRLGLAAAASIAALHLADFALIRLRPTIPRADLKIDQLGEIDGHGAYASWCQACQWIATSGQIPKDARFLTPIEAHTFKWRAGRPEVVTRKEIPQDARSIVMWWERLRDIHGIAQEGPRRYWYGSLAELGDHRLKELGAKYGADYVLTEAPGRTLPETAARPKIIVPRLGLRAVYENQGFIVYQLRGGPEQ